MALWWCQQVARLLQLAKRVEAMTLGCRNIGENLIFTLLPLNINTLVAKNSEKQLKPYFHLIASKQNSLSSKKFRKTIKTLFPYW